MVALMILITVSASTLLIFRSITRAWRTGTLRTERYQQARLLFDLFERELSSSVANVRYPFVGRHAGDPAPLESSSVADELFFVGTLPGRLGLIERGYWVNDDADLMCHDDDQADGNYATGQSEVCGRDVTGWVATYFDGTEWLDRWDGQQTGAQAGQVPKAVHIAVTIGQQRPETFETVIYVPTS